MRVYCSSSSPTRWSPSASRCWCGARAAASVRLRCCPEGSPWSDSCSAPDLDTTRCSAATCCRSGCRRRCFLAAGLGAARARVAGIAATVVLCAIGITAVISVDTTVCVPAAQLAAVGATRSDRGRRAARIPRCADHRRAGQPRGAAARALPEGPALHRVPLRPSCHRDRRGCRRTAPRASEASAGGARSATWCRHGSTATTPSPASTSSADSGLRTSACWSSRRRSRPRSCARDLPAALENERRHFIRSGRGKLQDAQLVEQGTDR